jgi:serine/threonine protein kinase
MIGKTIAHYQVGEQLGRGGMGEVYIADDLKLNRKVALKFLPDAFAGDPERMARFEREAKMLAALNHPTIASIYGLEQAEGKRFLVLELVEGETLAQRIGKRALPVDEALAICRQIAEGLEAAHEKGVIHRDLKPANVMITEGDKVKILDFGLAKALSDETQSLDPSQSPTLTEAMTQPGIIIGTAAYMSPEQAKGKSVDKRADIWAFGCILYECLTGKKAFEGETVTETLAVILKGEPDWEALPANTPSVIRMLLLRCLHKDRNARIHDAADARIELQEAISTRPELPGRTTGQLSQWTVSRALPWVLVVVLIGTIAYLSRNQLRNAAETPKKTIRFSIAKPKDLKNWRFPTLSPDGNCLVFAAVKDNTSQLYVRPMEKSEAYPIPGTEDAYRVSFFSPDGKWIAFGAGRELKKVSLEGGSPQVICQASFPGGAWGADGTIIYTLSYSSGLWRIPPGGGLPEKLTEPDSSRGELGHWWPQLLPDGETVLFTNYATPVERCSIAAYSLKTHRQKVLVKGAVFGHYLPTGHIVFARSTTLLAVPFDLQRMEVTGAEAQVLDDMAVELASASASASISDDGTLAYIRASKAGENYNLVRVDRKGVINPLANVQRGYSNPKLSPDGKRIAVAIQERGSAPDIWTYDLERGAFTRITTGTGMEVVPFWTRDGKRLIYMSEKPQFDLYWKAADGTGQEEQLLTSSFDKSPGSITRDGKFLIYSESNPKTSSDLWVLPLEGERKPKLWLQTAFEEMSPSLSPDGRWLAYVSNESRRNEVYIQAFPDHSERIPVSIEGGDSPMWAPSGNALFYTVGDKLMTVPVTMGEKIKVGKPATLIDFGARKEQVTLSDISLDGTWFVGVQRDPNAPPIEVEVVLNWFEELKRRVPVN